MGPERRGRADQGKPKVNPVVGEEPTETPKPKVKSFEIDKRLVLRAWEKVRANYGAPGVDRVSITEFGNDKSIRLYSVCVDRDNRILIGDTDGHVRVFGFAQ